MYHVYILYSQSHQKTYVGFTSDLEERLKSHNYYSKKGWTIRYRPWIVIYTEMYNDKKSAMAREKYFKTGAEGILSKRKYCHHFFNKKAEFISAAADTGSIPVLATK
jgi:putative endonuclease